MERIALKVRKCCDNCKNGDNDPSDGYDCSYFHMGWNSDKIPWDNSKDYCSKFEPL